MVRQCYPDRFERGVEEARLENDQTTKPVQGSRLAMGVFHDKSRTVLRGATVLPGLALSANYDVQIF